LNQQLQEAGAGWVESTPWQGDSMQLDSSIVSVKSVADAVEVIQGNPNKIAGMVNTFDSDWNKSLGYGSFVEQLGQLPKLDAVFFSARSGVHWGFMLRGFVKGLKEQGVNVDEPHMLASWYKVRNLVIHRVPAVRAILDRFSNAAEIEQFSTAQVEELLKSSGWEMKSGSSQEDERYKVKDWTKEAELFKTNDAPFLFEALEHAKEQIQSIVKVKDKRQLKVAVFDEQTETDATIEGMATLVECAAKKLQAEEPIDVEVEKMRAVSSNFPYGSYPTWEKTPMSAAAYKITRPTPNQPLFHLTHRVIMRAAEEVGRHEALKTLQSGGKGKAFLDRYLE
jgi:hypothetical protein